jgi:STE24 endopeptidase
MNAVSSRSWSVVGRACVISFALAWIPTETAAQQDEGRNAAQAFPPGVQLPAAAQPGPEFDVERATQAYLDLLDASQRARSDAYFEGRNWLGLWQTLYLIAAALLVLQIGMARKMSELAARWTRRRALQSMYFGAMFLAALWVLQLPMAWYADFYREHAYDLSTQSLASWVRDECMNGIFMVALGTMVIVVLYAFARRAGDAWIAWAAAFVFVFLLFVSLIAPVVIAPAFNRYEPLPAGELNDQLLSLARANGVPADRILWYDASRQTHRISANVSGFLGTTQISLNDNLLNDTSVPEIRAVIAHEMGHYLLNHVVRHAVYLTLVLTVGIAIVRSVVRRIAASRRGAAWGIASATDLIALPLVLAAYLGFLLLATPVTNRIVYAGEIEADLFCLNAAREPHGFATVAMRLAANRKLEPSPLEEWLFLDHPSGRARVHMAMQWFKENQTAMPDGRDDDPARTVQ